MPRCSASFESMITHAEAPSESWLALPAVIVPFSRTDLSEERPSIVVPGRLPSSWLSSTSPKLMSPVARSRIIFVAFIVMISSSKAPDSWPAAVRCWLWSPYSSCCSRVTP